MAELRAVVDDLQARGIRVSLFVDPEPAAVEWAASLGAERIELYTEPFAHAFKEGRGRGGPRASAATSKRPTWPTPSASGSTPATISTSTNLVLFRTLPHLDEVSIGHALISHALYVGLDRAVRDYLRACDRRSAVMIGIHRV